MTQQLIAVGTAANDGTGDPLRDGMIKANANFTELYGKVAALEALNLAQIGLKMAIETLTTGDVAGLDQYYQVVAAPGEGKALIPVKIIASITPGGTPLTVDKQTLSFMYGTDPTSPDIGFMPTGFLQAPIPTLWEINYRNGEERYENQPICMGLSGESRPSAGTATMVVYCLYQEVTLSAVVGAGSGIVADVPYAEVGDGDIIDGSVPIYIVTGESEVTIADLKQKATIKAWEDEITISGTSPQTIDDNASIIVAAKGHVDIIQIGEQLYVVGGTYTTPAP